MVTPSRAAVPSRAGSPRRRGQVPPAARRCTAISSLSWRLLPLPAASPAKRIRAGSRWFSSLPPQAAERPARRGRRV